ncbi:hypothetical protein BDZ85DRAFT_112389 [Elsinoe ampelina]|uniref:Zn(2)-C6 fungal-type domain-containing protein n=1 Tax=Elsinoe ampelina TaxID=302913 RepID=A0A6A6GD52_9PEZI|nr:hypothetical protein BDZ85DRAFT_112389 [Elsinoe ampelina]
MPPKTSGGHPQASTQSRVAKQTKSRGGCQRCKSKRLKCDETKPACDQCSRRGVVCPGYKVEFKSSAKYADFDSANLPTSFWSTADPSITISPSATESTPARHHGPSRRSSKSQELRWASTTTDHDTSPSERTRTQSCDGSWRSSDALTEGPIHIISTQGFNTQDGVNADQIEEGSPAFSDFISLPSSLPDDVPHDQTHHLVPWHDTRPSIPKTILDLPSFLVNYWFASICPMWSVFDSATNHNRMLASNVWAHSESAFYTLQAMSASYLADSLPALKRKLPGLTKRAWDAISKDMASLSTVNASSRSLPSGLLFALFAMGTSYHWRDPLKLSKWYISLARDILRQFEDDIASMDDKSRADAFYFRQALIWWNMLHDLVGEGIDDIGETHAKDRSHPSNSTAASSSSSQASVSLAGPQQLILHPWTGASTDIVEHFSLAVRLCHRHVARHKKHDMPTVSSLRAAMYDIELAHGLEQKLLNIDFTSSRARRNFDGSHIAETGDVYTPVEHLFDVAEATRLAALLHLYETFTDLNCQHALAHDSIDTSSKSSGTFEAQSRHLLLSRLALHQLSVLKRISTESRSRSCQLLLYISAAIGLRFEADSASSTQPFPCLFSFDDAFPLPSSMVPQTDNQPEILNPDFADTLENSEELDTNDITLSQHMLDVAEGRRFVTERLNMLQGVLPPQPISVALKLVKTIWDEYDDGKPETHWISVMNSSGLMTLFG